LDQVSSSAPGDRLDRNLGVFAKHTIGSFYSQLSPRNCRSTMALDPISGNRAPSIVERTFQRDQVFFTGNLRVFHAQAKEGITSCDESH
jgi:hypothetical protein